MDLGRIIEKFLDNAQTAGGASGTLALLIGGTLCVVYFMHPADNPEIGKTLTYALTTIIGFYFGTTSVSKGKDRDHGNDAHGHDHAQPDPRASLQNPPPKVRR
jgi:hypothetical protein